MRGSGLVIAVLLAAALSGCLNVSGTAKPVHAPSAAPTPSPAARPSIVLTGSFTAGGCYVPYLAAAAARGGLGDVKPVGSDAWGRTYTATANATGVGNPLCLTWLDSQGRYVWSPTPGVVPEKAATLLVEADGEAAVDYRITIR